MYALYLIFSLCVYGDPGCVPQLIFIAERPTKDECEGLRAERAGFVCLKE